MHQACCFSGHLDEALPLGRIERLGGVKCYTSKPVSTGSTAVIIASDLFGLNTQNVKLIADQFAVRPYSSSVALCAALGPARDDCMIGWQCTSCTGSMQLSYECP